MAPNRLLTGIGSHHSAKSLSDEWLTPPHVLEALGAFDLDPCACTDQPWRTAAAQLTIADDGLDAPWEGRVWLNPPYSVVEVWMEVMAQHDHGTALVFARTEVRWWADFVWARASAILFLEGRLTFHRPGGVPSKTGHNSGGPSALIAYGHHDAAVLEDCGLPGFLVREWSVRRRRR